MDEDQGDAPVQVVDLKGLDSISFVLVEPKQPGNIGSVARAMRNMGLKNLTLVNPADHKSGDARKMAVGSGDILYGARVCDSLQEALADVSLAAATTHRQRRHDHVLVGPQELARRVLSLPEGHRAAIVFGREEHGLTNDEIQLCQMAAKIPSAATYPSLNLSQAALIIGYELYRLAVDPPEQADLDLATHHEVESVFSHIESTLDKLGFNHRNRPKSFMRSVRRALGRIPMESRDAATFHKIFRQVDKFISRHGLDASGGEEE